jgi:CBS domain-containing protein
MQATAMLREPALRFDEPVRSLIEHKGKANAVFSIAPDATVYRAIELMSERRIGCLLVLVGGQLAGIISERDYARKVILMGRSSQQTLVREVMSKPVLFVTPEQTLDEAMRLMTNRRVRHLPVLEGDRVLGVLSIGDLVNWIISSQQQTIQQLHNFIAGQYPA